MFFFFNGKDVSTMTLMFRNRPEISTTGLTNLEEVTMRGDDDYFNFYIPYVKSPAFMFYNPCTHRINNTSHDISSIPLNVVAFLIR